MRVGIVGATGYAGSEAVRWVLGHPELELAAVVSSTRAGAPLADVVPALQGFTDLVLEGFDPGRLSALDAVFLATPHGVAGGLAPEIDAGVVIDLSRDHRHAPGWVYGLAEWTDLAGATRIAAPGCFATAIALALAPLVAAEAVAGPISVAAATGSTGSGASPKGATHHPERFADLKAYKVLRHQHVPEIRAFLGGLDGDPQGPPLHFVPLSAPVDRGIFATCFVPVRDVDPIAVFGDAYADTPLVRLRTDTPHLRHVRGTAACDLAVHADGEMAVVLSAIDNLGKGAAAQAVQCLNLSRGWPADRGLRPIPLTP